MAKKQRKQRGHFCWSCRSHLPNERFSGRGHQRHLCKECSGLGKTELEYRQAVRNIDRCLDWNGRLRRKQSEAFDGFRNHPSERVRRYVEELEASWAEEQRQWRMLQQQEETPKETWEKEDPAGTPAEASDLGGWP